MSSGGAMKPGGDKDAPKKAEKPVKIKLTKDQQAFVKEAVALENRIAVCREYIALWMQMFKFFAEDLSQREITPAEEKGFFQIMTTLARKQFLFTELMADKFDRGGDILNVLCTATSLSTVQAMQENTRGKLELDWHSLFLDMNKALGRLLRLLPGNMTLAQALEKVSKTQPQAPKSAAGAESAG